MLIEESNDTLYDQVADDIRMRIARRDFDPDGRIPNFRDLSRDYRVSLATIKKAMKQLAEQRVVTSRVGRGTFANLDAIPGERRRPETDHIGLLIRDLDGPYFSGIYRGLSEGAAQHNKRLLVTLSVDEHEHESALYGMLGDESDGVLVTSRRKSLYGVSIFDKLLRLRVPFVLLHDIYDSPTYCFDVNNYQGGRLVARHLMNRGVKKFAAIMGEIGYRVDDSRTAGFIDELRSGGVSIENDVVVIRSSFGSEATAFDEGYKLGMCLDLKGLGTQGVFLFNDLIAMGFQKALLERGFAIPHDIAVVGFDNIDRCSEARVPLTTVSVPRYELGLQAFHKLMDMVRTNAPMVPERILLDPALTIRTSA